MEFAWSSRDRSIRWTAEVAGPEANHRDRLDCALALIERIGRRRPVLSEALRQLFAHAALSEQMRFGAWIGGRHADEGDRYKLYVECSSRLPPQHAGHLQWLEEAVSRRIDWRMVGVDADGNGCEYYGRVPRLDVEDIEMSLQASRLVTTHPVGDVLRSLSARNKGANPFGAQMGISVTLKNRRPAAICWFGFPNAISSDSEKVGDALIRAAECFAGSTTVFTSLINDRQRPLGKIGLVGLGVADDGGAWVQAGWRPDS